MEQAPFQISAYLKFCVMNDILGWRTGLQHSPAYETLAGKEENAEGVHDALACYNIDHKCFVL